MTDQLPAEIAEAIEAFALACEDMGASYNSKGFPAPEREQIAKEARAALDAMILKHLGGLRDEITRLHENSLEARARRALGDPRVGVSLDCSGATDLGRAALAEEGRG